MRYKKKDKTVRHYQESIENLMRLERKIETRKALGEGIFISTKQL